MLLLVRAVDTELFYFCFVTVRVCNRKERKGGTVLCLMKFVCASHCVRIFCLPLSGGIEAKHIAWTEMQKPIKISYIFHASSYYAVLRVLCSVVICCKYAVSLLGCPALASILR